MINKKNRLFILTGLVVFLFVGSNISPGLDNYLLSTNNGEIPNSDLDNLESSHNQLISGSDGSNIGVFGYSNGTKIGETYDNDWIPESAARDLGNDYYRAEDNIDFPIPDDYEESPWIVTGVNASVNDLYAVDNFIEDPQFDQSGVWQATTIPEEGNRVSSQLSMDPPYGTENQLVDGTIGIYEEAGNDYFQGMSGLQFELAPNTYTLEEDFSANAPTPTFEYDVITDEINRFQSSQSLTRKQYYTWYTFSWGHWQYVESLCNVMECTAFGYDRNSQPGGQYYESNYFTHNGAPESPTGSQWDAFAPYMDWETGITRDDGTGNIDVTASQSTLVSVGKWTDGKDNEKCESQVSATWNDEGTYEVSIIKDISWIDDNSIPNVEASYDISMNDIFSDYTCTRIESAAGSKFESSWSHGNALATVSVRLYNPSEIPVASQPTLYFGFGEDYDSNSSIIHDNTVVSKTWDISDYMYHSSSSDLWSLRFDVTLNIENYGDTGLQSSGTGSENQDRAVSTEFQVENSIGINIDNFEMSIEEESPWDEDYNTDDEYKEVFYEHSQINFGNREVSEDINPTFEFDYYIPEGLIGHNYPNGDPENDGLQYGEPFARLVWDEGLPSEGEYVFLDSESFADVRGLPASDILWRYPWLAEPGHESETGGYHFYREWTGGALVLDGASTLDIQIGFRFYDEFNLDYDTDTMNSTIFLSNASFVLKTQPFVDEIDLELVWDQRGSGTDENYEFGTFSGPIQGEGSLDEMDVSGYEIYAVNPGRMFYFRTSSPSCSFSWSITLHLEYQYWEYDTEYTITSGQDAIYSSDVYIPIPTEGLYDDFRNNFMFDIIFPRYTMTGGGEPYWDLDSVYEQDHSENIYYGQENLDNALSGKGSVIMVCENHSDSYGLGNTYFDEAYLGTDAQYHQFARFHNELFDQWIFESSHTWKITWTAPNYLNELILDTNTAFDDDFDVFYEGEDVLVKGIYSNPMLDFNGLSDMGQITVGWYYPDNNTALPGGNSNPRDISVSSGSEVFVVDDDYYIGQGAIPPNSNYWVGAEYYDENACGDLKTSGDYCSGIFRLGFYAQNFTMVRSSYIDGDVYIPLPKSADNVPTYDTLMSDDLIPIMVTWRDFVSDAAITGADAKINVSTYYMDSGSTIEKFIKNEDGWGNAEMIDLNNGSYVVYVDPTTADHLGNMTSGFHNFSIILSKNGYTDGEITGNFSIIVDTIMTITSPSHTMLESQEYNPTSYGRPHFDPANCFATSTYTFTVELQENSTSPAYIDNNTMTGSPFYAEHVEVSYQLLCFVDSVTHTQYDYLEPGFINWTWFDETYGGQENTIINGSLQMGEGHYYVGNVTWPAFTETEDKGMNLYTPNIHVYYNITATITTERTEYSPDTNWQPNDVKAQYCEDNPADSVESNLDLRNSIEEIMGFTVHREGTGNTTLLTLLNDESDNGYAFENGEYDPDPNGDHQYDDFLIENYWYNATGEKFRLRVSFNCTSAESGNSFLAPPVGPLNYSAELYGVDYSGWMGLTEISLTGWNESSISLSSDSNYLVECTVNQSTPYESQAFGETYVTPWLYFDDVSTTTDEDTGLRYLTITASKPGFVQDSIVIKLNITEQLTAIYNETSEIQYDVDNPVSITTPTGIETSFTIRYNDTTNEEFNIFPPIEDAIITCVDDDWNGHFSNGYGSTWTYEEISSGVYNITLLDTSYDIYNEAITKELILAFNKGNYSTEEVKISLEITARELLIVYCGGKDSGLYTPDYLAYQYDEIAHINLTYKLLDLTNNSAYVDFDSSTIEDKFEFYLENGVQKYERTITKYTNSTGIFYFVVINSNLDIDGANQYVQDYLVNFTLSGLTNYYSTYHEHTIEINAVEMAISNRTEEEVTLQYKWSEYTEWIQSNPSFSFNLTDISHSSLYSLPIDVSDITSIFSSYDNPYIADGEEINPTGAINGNENIYLRTRFDTTTTGSYEYLQLIIDTRGLQVQDGLNIDIEIRKQNYVNVSVHLVINIINASSSIEGDQVIFTTIDDVFQGDVPDWTATTLTWKFYDNNDVDEIIEVPWGMIFAIKCGYESDSLALTSITGGLGNVGMSIEGLQAELIGYTEEYNGKFYYYFWADIETSSDDNNNITISVWKPNFEPASYEINYTIRSRTTEYSAKQSVTNDVIWTEDVVFKFEYNDLDYGIKHRNNTVEDVLINGSLYDEETILFDFGNDLNATWEFEKSETTLGEGYYIITIHTTNLTVNSTPYIFNFNITKLGPDNNTHWETQEFAIYVIVNPIELIVEYQCVFPDEELDLEDFTVGEGYLVGFSPEKYQNFSMYLRISYEIDGVIYYITDSEQTDVTLNLYDWSNDRGISNDNIIRKMKFEFIEMPELDFDGLWYLFISVEYENENDPSLPEDGTLSGYTALILNITTTNVNIDTKIMEWQILIAADTFPTPWWFWILATTVAVGAALIGTYSVKAALRRRIPYVLRMIDESIVKIKDDKFPTVGVMKNRNEFIIGLVVEYLDDCDIEWDSSERFEIDSHDEGEQESLPALNVEELKKELEKITSLAPDERYLFLDELKGLNRSAQIEFLKSLEDD